MAQVEMFPAVANSPATELTAAITDVQTTVSVLDASKLPDAPNIATIGVDESAETVRYEGKSGNDLTGVTRGFSGTVAKAWGIGVGVARYFTAYDADALRENVAGHTERLADIALNVRDFGAVGDGVTDDTAAIQSAIDYAIETGQDLIFPPGISVISGDGLVIWKPFRMSGPKGKVFGTPTTLRYTGTKACITVRRKETADGPFTDPNVAQVSSVFLERINITRRYTDDTSASSYYGNQAYGIDIYNSSESHYEQCAFLGFKVAIHAQGLSITEFVKCDITQNMYGAWLKKGAEDGSRSYSNPKVAFRDCNFFLNDVAHALPGAFQNVFDNCHMESSKRAFYFPMNSEHRLIDTLTISKCNINAGINPDPYFPGGSYPDATMIDIEFDASSVIQLDNIAVEFTRWRFEGSGAKAINLNTNGNSLSSCSINWIGNKAMGVPNGLVSSTSTIQPVVTLLGNNIFKTYDDGVYPGSFNVYGNTTTLNGFETNQSFTRALNLIRLASTASLGATEGIFGYNYTSNSPEWRSESARFLLPRLTKANTPPTSGTFKVGDVCDRVVTISPGMNKGWVCTSVSPLTWEAYGQIGNRTTTAAPSLTPYFVGEEVLDTTSKVWYKAAGSTPSDWRALN
jgi:hypothetical protein